MMKKKRIGPPFKNKNPLALKNPDIRQEAYNQFCAHLARGKDIRSWYFEHPSLRCSGQTMSIYIKNDKQGEFDPMTLEIAKAKGYAYWEQIVEDSAIGKNPNANTASLQMIVRNKCGWDKPEKNPVPETIENSMNDLIIAIREKR